MAAGKKTGGRKAGTKNKSTEEIKGALMQFVSINIDTIQRSFDTLDPKDQLFFLERLLKYYLPTHIQTNVDLAEKKVIVFRHEPMSPPDWWKRDNPAGTQAMWEQEINSKVS